MDTPLFGTLFVCGSMIISVVGLIIVRRFVNLEWLKKHHEIASYFFLMIGTLYAVLIAFAIYVVWTQFQDAGAKLEAEANAVGDLSRMAAGLPDAQRAQIRTALLNYIHAVLDDEFPAMAEGRESPRTWAAMQALMDTYTKPSITDVKDQVFTTESLKHLNELVELPPLAPVYQSRHGASAVVVSAVRGRCGAHRVHLLLRTRKRCLAGGHDRGAGRNVVVQPLSDHRL